VDLRSPGGGVSNLQVSCGESGLGIRMFTPILSLSENTVTINGEGSLVTRPMDFFDEILPELGVSIQSNNGRLPLIIKGPANPRDIEIDGSLSSQFLTGLLLAYAASGAENITITVNNLKSLPYIDLTLKVMEHFGLRAPRNNDYRSFYFGSAAEKAAPSTITYIVEGDWSGGAFLLVAGAVAGNIEITGLDPASPQADKKILEALKDAGAAMSVTDEKIILQQSSLTGFSFDATHCPDLFPPLVALAAYCEGQTVIKGVSRLAHKESDRGTTLKEEFGKMGLKVQLDGDLMIIEGVKALKASTVHSRHDHRIAMACAVAALRADGSVLIENAEAINKSYPDFYTDIQKLGAVVNSE
jgi:3-phosphoshikimate 1-carboxyvinyltransferase